MKKLAYIACAALCLNIFGCGKTATDEAKKNDPPTGPTTTRSVGDTLTVANDYSYTLPWPMKDFEQNKLFIVRSAAELANFVNYPNDSIPPIDYSVCSVLNVCGTSPNAVQKINACLTWQGEGKYKFSVNIYQTDLTQPELWKVCLSVNPAIGPSETVALDVQYK